MLEVLGPELGEPVHLGAGPDVRVEPVRLVRGTGRVILSPADRAAIEPSAIRIGARPVDFDGNPGPSYSDTVRDDLTFEVRA